ncbi:enoyl-CoA hydratase-related protein [Actinomycetospora chlora]|uniref:Enoyl-CoA hydratase-related protein n=1 Tax=Actinomycetospora chlora TaxID=663608 RepID=A0ABP9AA72_9PSEU
MGDPARIRVEQADGVCRLVLASPERHNAVDHAFGRQFLAATTGPARDARCVEIVAEGANFCVGGDIGGFAAEPDRSLSELADAFHAGERALLDLAVPVVVGVNGWAAGIGLSLALCGDVVVLGEGARLRPAYTAIGLTPDGGMTATLPAAAGRARAMDMFLTNRPMGAAEALACGLASRVVDDDSLRLATDGVAEQIAAGPTAALAATKRLVRQANGVLSAEHLDAESASIGERGKSAEGREGITAFLGKRAPRWPSAS